MRIKRLPQFKREALASCFTTLTFVVLMVAVAGFFGAEARAQSKPSEPTPSPPIEASTTDDAGQASIPSSPASPVGPIRVSGGVMAANARRFVSPVYPAEAKDQHVQGAVVLHAIVSKTGEVQDLSVISGPEMLQQAAIDAVQQWQYKPYLLNGKPVEVQTTITVNFSLNDAATPPRENAAPLNAGIPSKGVENGVSGPVVIHQVPPKFTAESRKAQFKGAVLVNLIVDRQGMPQNVHVLRGVGMGLDAKAIEAVKQYRFKPAMEGGKPVSVELNVEVNFEVF